MTRSALSYGLRANHPVDEVRVTPRLSSISFSPRHLTISAAVGAGGASKPPAQRREADKKRKLLVPTQLGMTKEEDLMDLDLQTDRPLCSTHAPEFQPGGEQSQRQDGLRESRGSPAHRVQFSQQVDHQDSSHINTTDDEDEGLSPKFVGLSPKFVPKMAERGAAPTLIPRLQIPKPDIPALWSRGCTPKNAHDSPPPADYQTAIGQQAGFVAERIDDALTATPAVLADVGVFNESMLSFHPIPPSQDARYAGQGPRLSREEGAGGSAAGGGGSTATPPQHLRATNHRNGVQTSWTPSSVLERRAWPALVAGATVQLRGLEGDEAGYNGLRGKILRRELVEAEDEEEEFVVRLFEGGELVSLSHEHLVSADVEMPDGKVCETKPADVEQAPPPSPSTQRPLPCREFRPNPWTEQHEAERLARWQPDGQGPLAAPLTQAMSSATALSDHHPGSNGGKRQEVACGGLEEGSEHLPARYGGADYHLPDKEEEERRRGVRTNQEQRLRPGAQADPPATNPLNDPLMPQVSRADSSLAHDAPRPALSPAASSCTDDDLRRLRAAEKRETFLAEQADSGQRAAPPPAAPAARPERGLHQTIQPQGRAGPAATEAQGPRLSQPSKPAQQGEDSPPQSGAATLASADRHAARALIHEWENTILRQPSQPLHNFARQQAPAVPRPSTVTRPAEGEMMVRGRQQPQPVREEMTLHSCAEVFVPHTAAPLRHPPPHRNAAATPPPQATPTLPHLRPQASGREGGGHAPDATTTSPINASQHPQPVLFAVSDKAGGEVDGRGGAAGGGRGREHEREHGRWRESNRRLPLSASPNKRNPPPAEQMEPKLAGACKRSQE